MTNPIKLTDEVLRVIEDCHYYVGNMKVEELTDAIRTLRDRARAVCDKTVLNQCMECGDADSCVTDRKAIERLEEILP